MPYRFSCHLKLYVFEISSKLSHLLEIPPNSQLISKRNVKLLKKGFTGNVQIFNGQYIHIFESYIKKNIFYGNVDVGPIYEEKIIQVRKRMQTTKRFLANMSHEIRTPMNSIIALSDLAKRSGNMKEEHLDCIMNSANILLKMLGDILEYSKLETLSISINNKKYNTKELLSTVLTNWYSRFEEKDISFNIKNKNLPDRIILDKERFHQILNVLLSNSLKYTKSGSVHVELYIRKNFLHVIVKDTGVGIPNSENSLFEPFERRNSYAEGTGLGLGIAKSILKHLGGNIWYRNRKKKGSSFHFKIPQKCDDDFSTSSNSMIPESQCIFNENIYILIVEDNKTNQFVMKEILSLMDNVRFDIVGSGEECIVSIENHRYDVVFMDIVLPGMDGVETSKYIRKNLEKPPWIIACTANSISGDRKRYLRHMNDYISKPIKITNVQNALTKYLNEK